MTGLFDAYQIVAVILPGAVVVFGLLLLFPQLRKLGGQRGIGLGNFGSNRGGIAINLGDIGLHVLIGLIPALVVGLLINSAAGWVSRQAHTFPTQQVRQVGQKIIPERQFKELSEAVMTHFNLDIHNKSVSSVEWFYVTRQMHMRISSAKRADRIDSYLRTFGLTRNLAAASFMLSAAMLFRRAQLPNRTRKQRRQVRILLIAAILAVLIGVVLIQIMLNYSESYARELFLELIALPRP